MAARECNDIRTDTEVLVVIDEPLGDRTLVVRSVGGDPSCLVDGETSLRCTVFFTGDS
jgi:hypothetical protein